MPFASSFDITARTLHWLLAVCLFLNIFFLEEGEIAHRLTGYSCVILVALRFFWGFKGGPASRFQGFTKQHNFIASFAYFSLWGLLLSLGLSGFLMGTDRYFGDDQLKEIHGYFAYGIKIFFLLHMTGIFIHSIRRRRFVWLTMIHGRRVP